MNSKQEALDQLTDIKHMMEKSSRFLSLSGGSGVVVGIIGIISGFLLRDFFIQDTAYNQSNFQITWDAFKEPILIGALSLLLSFLSVIFLSFRKSKKLGNSVWDHSAKRMVINLFIPLIAGGLVIIKLGSMYEVKMLVPITLIFYGLALINASKYTLGEIRYMGIVELILGLLCLFLNQSMVFWMLGFGLAHIVYGVFLWNKYEK